MNAMREVMIARCGPMRSVAIVRGTCRSDDLVVSPPVRALDEIDRPVGANDLPAGFRRGVSMAPVAASIRRTSGGSAGGFPAVVADTVRRSGRPRSVEPATAKREAWTVPSSGRSPGATRSTETPARPRATADPAAHVDPPHTPLVDVAEMRLPARSKVSAVGSVSRARKSRPPSLEVPVAPCRRSRSGVASRARTGGSDAARRRRHTPTGANGEVMGLPDYGRGPLAPAAQRRTAMRAATRIIKVATNSQ
jgi:hypothetical protein